MIRPRCTVCGRPALYRCKYCGDSLCGEHLPPDKHWCVGERHGGAQILRQGLFRYYLSSSWNLFGIFHHNCSYLLMFIIALSFLLQLIIPGYTQLLILNPHTMMERPWTLVTHIFLHSTLRPDHLLINLLVFFFFAPVLERRVGSTKFLLVFFLSGTFAGIGYCIGSPAYPALGASGAIFGILGALAMLMPRMRVYFIIFPMEMWMMVILFALYDFFMIGAPDMIAHTAHLSGLLFGLLAGWMESRNELR